MNASKILANETNNNGQMVHCYYDHEEGTWLAYGRSAYALRRLIKQTGQDNLRRYSHDLNTSCSMVGNNTMMGLCDIFNVQTKTNEYICIESNLEFDMEAYDKWIERLKNERSHKKQMWVDTNVSDKLSNEGLIADGMSSFACCTKHIADFIFAGICLLLFSPLILIIFILVKAEDGGPAIFKQERIGRHGRPFNIYKFRTMHVDAERQGPQLSHSGGTHDPRLTKIGKFLRAHHLDELPQLWNVFIGDMSFVGPRPERQYYIDKIMEYNQRYIYLYQIRPGVTSYATLYNGYTDTMEKMLRRLDYDLYYLEHRSWWFDLKILFNTFCAIAFGKKF